MRSRRAQAGVILVRAMIGMLGALLVPGIGRAAGPVSSADQSLRADELRGVMRKLWQDRSIYTRAVAIGVAADLPDLVRSHQRLVRNQVDIGDAVRPYFGDMMADVFTALLQEEVNRACAAFTAAKSGDPARREAAETAWRGAAADVASFVSAVDSSAGSQDTLVGMVSRLVDATAAQMHCRLKGDWTGDLAAFEMARQYARITADALSLSIAHQCAEQFAGEFTPAMGAASASTDPILTTATAVPTPLGAEIVLNLAAAAVVAVDITNIGGQPVRQLAAGYAVAPGVNSLVWDGNTDVGLRAPEGTYIVTARAQSASGASSRTATTLYLAR